MSHGRVVAATVGSFVALSALVGWKVVPGIEADLEFSVLQALSSRGIRVASVTAEGRTINLVGGPESPEERLALASVTRSVPGVLRVRSPLAIGTAGTPAGEDDPVRVSQAEREVSVAPVSDGPPVHAPVETVSRAMDDPASQPGRTAADVPPAASSEARPAASSETGTAPSSESRPAASSGAPQAASSEAPRPSSCQARLTVLAEGRSIPFGRGEATLASRDRSVLEEVGAVMRGCGEWALTIVGYAGEDEGTDAWALADRRAYAVARYLSDRGVEVSRLATVAGTPALDPIGEPRAELYVTGGL